jgi:hypothetical protein
MEKLIVDAENNLSSIIMDEEGDEIECRFNYDMCVELNTKDYTYVTLSIQNLYELIDLIERAEYFYKNKLNF